MVSINLTNILPATFSYKGVFDASMLYYSIFEREIGTKAVPKMLVEMTTVCITTRVARCQLDSSLPILR